MKTKRSFEKTVRQKEAETTAPRDEDDDKIESSDKSQEEMNENDKDDNEVNEHDKDDDEIVNDKDSDENEDNDEEKVNDCDDEKDGADEAEKDEEEKEEDQTKQTKQMLPQPATTDLVTLTQQSTPPNDEPSPLQEKQPQQPPSSCIETLSFEALGVVPVLCEACTKAGWNMATPIQTRVLPYVIQGRDVIGLAQTGSGKSGAFVLPILQQLVTTTWRRGAVAAVVLTPTRELALQIHVVVLALGQASIGVTSCVVVGGIDRVAQAVALARHPHIVIATPGRLVDHLKDTKGFTLRHVRFLVLDEADRMLSLDFEAELNQILDAMPSSDVTSSTNSNSAATLQRRQTMLFSATMTSQVQKLQRACLHDPVRIEVSTKFQTPSQLKQYYLFIPAKYKDCYLTYLINEHAGQSILVFGATCNNVQRLALLLRNLGFPAVALHGQMPQPARLGALAKFSSHQRSILICTDVASRGLDLPNVDLVINFDLPGHGKEYIHRVGRTARAGKAGQAIALVTQYDVEVYQRLEGLLNCKLPAYPIASEETVLILLERTAEAQRLATRELKEQLAARGSGGGRRHRPNRNDGEYNDGEGGDGDYQSKLTRESKLGYRGGGGGGSFGTVGRGGSGGRGGALPNQRGSHKQKQPRSNSGGGGGGRGGGKHKKQRHK
jgi:ATP-dependent RNA helicase DDX47/RRP3